METSIPTDLSVTPPVVPISQPDVASYAKKNMEMIRAFFSARTHNAQYSKILGYLKSWKFWVITIIVIALLIMVYRHMKRPHMENMEVVSGIQEHQIETKQENIPIQPTDVDEDKHIVQSGPEYSPNPLMSPWYQAYTGNLKNYYLLDDGENGTAGLNFNQCSKSCCSDQYPLPFKMPADESVCASKDSFVPTNYTCNNAWQDSGCVCLTKDQANFLGSRGGNA